VPLAGRKVAIIEDDLTTAMVAERICRKLGARETVVCADRACAAATLTDPASPVDVILLDMMLGADDGLATLRNLDPRTLRAEIVPVSAKDPRAVDAAVRLLAGRGFRVHGAIEKPLTAEKLGRALARAALATPAAEGAIAQASKAELEHALAHDEFVPFYQFKCDCVTLRPLGVELLARWQHPTRALIGPAHFITGLEQGGLIASMTERLLLKALRNLAALGETARTLGLALNISAPTLADPALPDRLQEIVGAYGIDPGRVTFEITESAVLQDPLALLEGTARLRLHGFRLAIDDFGTGWSSLDLLRTLPFTELKIDRSFVSGAPHDAARQVILGSTVAMARGLGLDIVAEGVETEAERALLQSLGVPVIQGWLTGRPLNFHALAAALGHRLGADAATPTLKETTS
jgi:EAL domain-containing protein (putative c-di-GMP-specific phosphodiesterase class I)/ActR/RegA family two-component response regulator